MRYIKSLYIKGFKKFDEITVHFNEHMNILVGETEAGKSTILEAIKIVLNQMYKNADKSILKDLFNKTQMDIFNGNPSLETLPKIEIELDLELDPTEKNTEYFFGENSRNAKAIFGIKFECSFNEDIDTKMTQSSEVMFQYI